MTVEIAAAGRHLEPHPPAGIAVKEQPAVLQYLMQQDLSGRFHVHDIHPAANDPLQLGGHLQTALETVGRINSGPEQNRHVGIATGTGLTPCPGTEQVRRRHVGPAGKVAGHRVNNQRTAPSFLAPPSTIPPRTPLLPYPNHGDGLRHAGLDISSSPPLRKRSHVRTSP